MNLNSLIDHEVKFEYINNLANTINLNDSLFYGYQPVRLTYTLNNTDIGNTTNFMLTSVANSSFSTFNNSSSLHYINFKYPKSTSLSNNLFNSLFIDDMPGPGKQSFILANPNVGTTNTIVAYDITNGKRFPYMY
ncbi:MAG: hypothetical protein IPJ60_07785 [Sphingobacteriaceae bacterium]|nr:hypothetical protein [Sphingobacteriaceae bacterium]